MQIAQLSANSIKPFFVMSSSLIKNFKINVNSQILSKNFQSISIFLQFYFGALSIYIPERIQERIGQQKLLVTDNQG
jgi:hypothetical protein